MSITTTHAIEEAILIPLVAIADITETRVTTLMAAQQKQTEDVFRLIAELQAENERLRADLQIKPQEEEIKVDALAAEIATLRLKSDEADKKHKEANEKLHLLLVQEKFLFGTPEGWRLRLEPLNQRLWALPTGPRQNLINQILSRNAQTYKRQDKR